MTRHATARKAARVAALLAAAGLTLAGCKSSASATGAASSPAAGGSSSAAASGSASAGASGSGGAGQAASNGGTAYFPAAVGNTWVYQTTISGLSHGTITNKITAVTPVAGGQRVTMEILTGLGAGTHVTYIFHSDGSISVPFTQVGNTAVKITSGSIVWPSAADLSSGQVHNSTLGFQVTVLGHVTHVAAHVAVQGKGSQSVSVPAGTYQAQVIDETISEKVEGAAVSLTVQTWLANGVGPVKSELATKAGTTGAPTTIEVLKSFTKG